MKIFAQFDVKRLAFFKINGLHTRVAIGICKHVYGIYQVHSTELLPIGRREGVAT